MFGLDDETSSDLAALLNKFCQIQQEIGLEPLDELTLQTWYLNQKIAQVNNNSIVFSLKQKLAKRLAVIDEKRAETKEIKM